jgi:hypothetical protein
LKLRIAAFCTLLSLFTLLVLLTPGATPRIAAQGSTVKGPTVGAPVTPKSFNGDVRTLPQIGAAVVKARLQPRLLPHPNSITSALPVPDTVEQKLQPVGTMPAPIRNFKGLDYSGWGTGWGPDTSGDVGPNHYIQAVNDSIGIFGKGGTRLAAFTFDTLWSAAPGPVTPCDNRNAAEPSVIHDPLADRWVIADFGWSGLFLGPYYECIAISKSGDPISGGWWFYPIFFDATLLDDSARFGFWPDAYYTSSNLYASGFSFQGVRVFAFDRSKMINGQSIQPVSFDLSTAYFSLLPANLRGALPPSGSPEYYAAVDSPSSNTIHVWKFHFDPTTPSNSWFGSSSGNPNPVDVSVAPFVEPCGSESIQNCVPEKGANSSQYLDSLGDRLMMLLQYRNINGTESLWANHSVASSANVGSQIGLRWYQLDVTGGAIATTPVQQSTFKPGDGIYRWLGSLAVDQAGNMALGYSASSTGMYPAIRYVGRLATDPPNTLGQGEMTLIAGSGAQTNNPSGSPISRWTDYSAMSVDPVDDCTFWYTNEYYAVTGYNWQTRIGSFKFPGCSGGQSPNAVEEFDPNVQYDGWRGVVDANASGGSYRVSDTRGNTASFVFTGTSVKWVYRTGPDEGNAQVAIDGVNKGSVNLYAAIPQEQVIRQFAGLANAAHTLTIKVLGTTSGSDTKVVVDAFVVGSTRTEETAKSVRYNSWAGASNSKASGGMFRYSQTLNAVATFHFTGTGVKWITLRGPGYGMARVWIDGWAQGPPVDLYVPALQGHVGFSYPGLPAGPHWLQVQVLHTKNPSAVGYKVAVDAFDVTP